MIEDFSDRERWIWLACFIDTDGTITISYTRFPYYYPTIILSGSKQGLLEEAMMGFNRGIWQDKELRKSGVKAVKFFGRHIRPMLMSLLPFLILKKQQAKLCIEYLDYLDQKEVRASGVKRELDVYERELITKIRKLNATRTGKWHKPRFE